MREIYYSRFFFGLIFLGLVLFLEEDHFVSEDFLHVLKLVEAERTQKYSNCDIICLGTYLKSYNYNRNHKNVSPAFGSLWYCTVGKKIKEKRCKKIKFGDIWLLHEITIFSYTEIFFHEWKNTCKSTFWATISV